MSASQRVRRGSPCSKQQGPMRATLPVSCLTRNLAGLANPQSPSKPDAHSSGLRSPGAVDYRGKWKTLSGQSEGVGEASSVMRRTVSLDTIYLKGQWPRVDYPYSTTLQVDRSTQTDDWLGDARKNHRHLDHTSEDKFEKYIRHRRIGREWSSRERTSGYGQLSSSGANTPGEGQSIQHRYKMRSSIEGLNQEIERLVLRSSAATLSDREERKGVTPEGHRAPVADLLRQTRSVNTQTPAPSYSTSGGSSRDGGSPLVPSLPHSRPSSDLHGGSEDSSPENEGRNLGTSPRINRFLAREPPDGCERVSLKFTEESRKAMVDISEMNYPLKPSMNFQLKPSLGSAFHPPRSIPTPEPASQ